MGGEVGLAHVDPGEVVRGKVRRNLDYVSVDVERVSFPELPEAVRGNDAALGFEVRGLLPDGKTLKAVAGLMQMRGAGTGLYADHALFIEPTLYPGRVVEIQIFLQAIPRDEASPVRALLLAAGQATRRFSPTADPALDAARNVFSSVFEGATASRPVWRYVFQFFPADTVIADKPETLFTAARHIVLVAPSPDSRDAKAVPSPDVLRARLKLEGNRLIDRTTGRDYHASPYVVINVTRFRRAPVMKESVAKAKRDVETALAQKNADLADSFEKTLRDEISKSGLSTREKHLEDAWRLFFQLGIEALRAASSNDGARGAAASVKQALALLDLKSNFRDLLELYEIEEIRFRLQGLVRALRADAEKRGVPIPLALAKALAEDGAREREIAGAEKSEEAKWKALLARAAVGWVEVEHTERGAPEEPEATIRARALDAARVRVVEKSIGGGAGGRYVVSNAAGESGPENRRVVEDFDALMADAMIVDEEILAAEFLPARGNERSSVHVRLRARAALRGPRADAGFRVTAKLSRRDLREGDAVEAKITTTRDAYLYVFSVDADGTVTVVIPNRFVEVPFVRAGETYIFPPDALRRRVRLAARLPRGRSHVVESLKVIALRKKIALYDDAGPATTFQSHAGARSLFLSSILKRLAAIDSDDWRDTRVSYTIRAKE